MLGAIIGDTIGSVYEFNPVKHTNFELFSDKSGCTDDSVLTVAVAKAILTGTPYEEHIRDFGLRYFDGGYGLMFKQWLLSEDPKPYNSFGNGSAMRVSPVGFAFNTIEEVLNEAKKSAECTHNHPEGIKGAQATALVIFMGRTGSSKDEIKKEIVERFGYDLSRTIDEVRETSFFNETCQGTVPESIIAFLDSTDYESAIRNAISLGADADTNAAITGSMAEAFYKEIPETLIRETYNRMPTEFIDIVSEFNKRYFE